VVKLSVVIPTFNSKSYIHQTLTRLAAALETISDQAEVIIVDDGSTDGTWLMLNQFIKRGDLRPEFHLLRLAKNCGQHTALLCGLRTSRGEYVVTLDDDLQNDPFEIPRILEQLIDSDADVAIVAYPSTKKSLLRSAGSSAVNALVTLIFKKSWHISLSPFRILNRRVTDQICNTKVPNPYITGEILRATNSVINVEGTHHPRVFGQSNYGLAELWALTRRILYSYSVGPLRWAIRIGLVASFSSAVFSILVVARALTGAESVPGWASTMFIVSAFNTQIMLILSILGIYIGNILFSVRETNGPVVQTIVSSAPT
jgi:glycosyltransferase involved in cell wall biosynthesis